MLDFAASGVAGGASLHRFSRGQRIDVSDIPVNPFLFGDEPNGRRGLVVANMQLLEDSQWFTTYIDVPDFGNFDDLYSILHVEANIRLKYIPGLGLVEVIDDPFPWDVQFMFAERRF